MFGKPVVDGEGPVACELCKPGEDGAMKMTLQIQRLDDGKVKASYQPADTETSTVMNH